RTHDCEPPRRVEQLQSIQELPDDSETWLMEAWYHGMFTHINGVSGSGGSGDGVRPSGTTRNDLRDTKSRISTSIVPGTASEAPVDNGEDDNTLSIGAEQMAAAVAAVAREKPWLRKSAKSTRGEVKS
ncbi:hypothetical protein B5M09_012318, partial [Aphanomyces astaci]